MADSGDVADPKGLIREAYRIDGISKPECRSIFLDWALSLPGEGDAKQSLQVLLARHGTTHPDHPMTEVMTEGLGLVVAPRRRGGWRTRTRD